MRKVYKKIESWIWIILLIGALMYFHWLLGGFHSENEKFKESQKQLGQEIEEKYEKNKQLQTEVQAQLSEITQKLLKFLKAAQSNDPAERGDPKSY